jgi:hypothetical protein
MQTTSDNNTPTAGVVNLASQQGYRRSDRELADAALAAVKQLQDAMDDLIKAGLTVEPAIKIVENRFSNLGLSVDSYLINLNVWRKLS